MPQDLFVRDEYSWFVSFGLAKRSFFASETEAHLSFFKKILGTGMLDLLLL